MTDYVDTIFTSVYNNFLVDSKFRIKYSDYIKTREHTQNV